MDLITGAVYIVFAVVIFLIILTVMWSRKNVRVTAEGSFKESKPHFRFGWETYFPTDQDDRFKKQ